MQINQLGKTQPPQALSPDGNSLSDLLRDASERIAVMGPEFKPDFEQIDGLRQRFRDLNQLRQRFPLMRQ